LSLLLFYQQGQLLLQLRLCWQQCQQQVSRVMQRWQHLPLLMLVMRSRPPAQQQQQEPL
jgi:hypothetical protein